MTVPIIVWLWCWWFGNMKSLCWWCFEVLNTLLPIYFKCSSTLNVILWRWHVDVVSLFHSFRKAIAIFFITLPHNVNMNIILNFFSHSRYQQWRLQPFPWRSRVCRYYPKGGTSYREWRISREDFPGFQWELLCQGPKRGEEGMEQCHW